MFMTLELLGSRLLATSVQTAVFAGLVWLLCRYVRRLPASTQCGLWWLVALQAVVGAFWASPLELPLLPAVDAVPVMVRDAATGAVVTTAPLTITQPLPVDGAWPWGLVLMMGWLGGVVIMALRTLLAIRSSGIQLRAALPCHDERISAALAHAAKAHGLRRAPRLMLSNAIDSPQLVGLWHPVLMLPMRDLQRMGDDQLDMALTHELVHLQRHDLWFGLVPVLAQHLFFFHPAVHLISREYGIAREAAVDAVVVAGDRHCRHHYGRLLLQFGVAARPGAGLASASPNFLSLKRRLRMLQDTSSFPRVGAALILGAVALLGVAPLRLVATPVAVPPSPEAASVKSASESTHAGSPAAESSAMPASPASVPPGSSLEFDRLTVMDDAAEGRPANAFVLLNDGRAMVNSSIDDLYHAEKLDQGEGVLWFHRDGRDFVMRDPVMLSRFEKFFAEELGLAAANAQIGARVGELAAEAARRKLDQAREEMDNPAMRAEMESLAAQQRELGKRQAELGRQQAAASAKASRDAEQMIREAISSGIAQPLGG